MATIPNLAELQKKQAILNAAKKQAKVKPLYPGIAELPGGSTVDPKYQGEESSTPLPTTMRPNTGGAGAGGAPSFIPPEVLKILTLNGKIPWFAIPLGLGILLVLVLVTKKF